MVGVFRIITHIFFLYALLLIGNFLQEVFHLFIPGSVIGMLLLFLLLKMGIIKIKWMEEGTSLLLRHLTLFFIPVTIGFMEYLELFKGKGIFLLLITVISTALVMGVGGAVSEQLAHGKETQHE
ncbi:CidA/LrgA family protein [Oceanobacillus indicireducens]|uniref:Holin-like protein CidA n=1 Tax=Oceanobacillus indicireducens TaxID=1004261 RepID=A0A918CYX7_9BACI|nr:CidA/LrgA family protein [Oceanobacillus indicireducens]GGN50728.1 holin-like protein CidA [Oceanobacillus indicireducens]